MAKREWITRHLSDEYVKRAQKDGYPSRAAYKLLEIQERDRLIKPGMSVIDLGSAPGGWSIVAKNIVGKKGKVIAIDCLPMQPISGVEFIQQDFTSDEGLSKLIAATNDEKVDVILSDMAPNLTGHKSSDLPQSIYLVELALDLCQTLLKPDGTFLAKIFQGIGSEELVALVKKSFRSVKYRKPKASRPKSREIYILATGFCPL